MTAILPRSLRILVVDDEESVRVSLSLLLRLEGHLVDTASSAEEALATFRERRFDLVITDYSITGMDGPEFATAIKAHAQWCPVVMITAYAHTLPPTLPCVDAIVGKPFSSEELSNAIAKAMTTGSSVSCST